MQTAGGAAQLDPPLIVRCCTIWMFELLMSTVPEQLMTRLSMMKVAPRPGDRRWWERAESLQVKVTCSSAVMVLPVKSMKVPAVKRFSLWPPLHCVKTAGMQTLRERKDRRGR